MSFNDEFHEFVNSSFMNSNFTYAHLLLISLQRILPLCYLGFT